MKMQMSMGVLAWAVAFLAGIVSAETPARVGYTVYFKHGSARLEPDAANVAEEVAAFAMGNSLKKVILTGYCDASEANRPALARNRAKAVADRLHSLRIPDRVTIVVNVSGDLLVPTVPNAAEPLNRCVTVAY